MRHRVAWSALAYVSEKPAKYIARVFYPEKGGSKLLQNIGTYTLIQYSSFQNEAAKFEKTPIWIRIIKPKRSTNFSNFFLE